MLLVLLPLWYLWLLTLTPISGTVIMWTCDPHLAWRSGCVFYPPSLCYLGGLLMNTTCSLCPLTWQLANMSPLWMWTSAPPWQFLGRSLAPPLPGILFLAHTCCPSVGCDFKVSFEHSTLSPLNLILKLSCLVFKSLAKNIPLGLCDKLPIPCQGPVIPALSSTVQKNSRSQISYRAALCFPDVPVSSQIMIHGWGRN